MGENLIDLKNKMVIEQIFSSKNLLSAKHAKQFHILPLSENELGLNLVIGESTDIQSQDTISLTLNKMINFFLAEDELVNDLIEKLYKDSQEKIAANVDDNDSSLVQLVNEIISQAKQLKASDIHIEPLQDALAIRIRIDGKLEQVNSLPLNLHNSIVSRIKIMTETMSIDEKRLPQDGRIQKNIDGQMLDLRVSIIPTSKGESVVMRLLDKNNLSVNMSDLGLMTEDRESLENLSKMANGIVLVTGPTGSGKTTTLYSCLNQINDESRKIITVEDPIEYVMPGVNQVHVKSEIGMTFASALRSILRQAPNVIMVGEIRDEETAGVSINAALTGHLVMSTLHTNDATSAISRLINVGAKPFLVSSAVKAVVAQRLCRKLCSCKTPHTLTENEMQALGLKKEQCENVNICKANGCELCRGTGFKGRIGIFEIFNVSEEIAHLINQMGDSENSAKKVSSSELRKAARINGMKTLREDGFQKVFAGLTTFQEVLSVTMRDES